jgi:hypothetical protein
MLLLSSFSLQRSAFSLFPKYFHLQKIGVVTGFKIAGDNNYAPSLTRA